ncbi:MAG: DUF3786 domain-containing protein [Desulfobacula sp.]
MSDFNIDKANFSDLEACDPADVMSRTGCVFDSATRQYRIKIWGHMYCADLEKYEVRSEEPGLETYHGYMYLFILYFLMKSKQIPLEKKWVSEKDIKGGAAFFRGPHTLPVNWISKRFGNDINAFRYTCGKLGGTPLALADAAFSFKIAPTVPVAVLYWLGDEDFPSEAKLLFDRTLEQHLPLDIIYALAVEICHSISDQAVS